MQHGDHHGPAGRAELLEDRLDVDLDGGVAAAEAAGDLLVAEPGRQLVEHLALAPGEGSQRRRQRRLRLGRSEEHTSELQSLMRISYAVFCLKKKKTKLKTDNVTLKT